MTPLLGLLLAANGAALPGGDGEDRRHARSLSKMTEMAGSMFIRISSPSASRAASELSLPELVSEEAISDSSWLGFE